MKRVRLSVLFFLLIFAACSDEREATLSDVTEDASTQDVSAGDVEVQKEDYAFIVNASSDYKSASYSVMRLSDRSVKKDIGLVHTDAVAKTFNGLIYVVNRLGADNITILDPSKDFAVLKQFSTGAGSNPQDVAIYKDRLFITKQMSNEVDVLSTSDYSRVGTIDVSKYADADGNAEPQDMIVYKDRLYLTILRLDKNNYYSPTDKSYLLVIDPESYKVEKEVVLGSTNPFAGIVLDEENERIIIGETGSFGANDGRVEFYNIKDGIITQQVITESDWGGDLNKIAYAKNKIFAVISDANFNTALMSYDLAGSKLSEVYKSNGFSIAGISIYKGSELFMCDRDLNKPGIRIFSVEDLTQKTTEPIDTGLPPVSIVFFEL